MLLVYLLFYESSFAIIVGVNKLQDGSILLHDTPNAINDAKAIEEILVAECDFPQTNVYTLYKEQATKENILNKIKEVLAKTNRNDRFLVFFAGHGNSTTIKKNEEGYLIPYDAKCKKNEPTWDSVVGFCDLIDLVTTQSQANQNLFLLDCCFSGIACKMIDVDESIRGTSEDIQNSTTDRKSIEIFTASSKYEKIADRGQDSQHSIFTQKIIEFLSNAKAEEYKKEGFISARRLSTVVTSKVVTESWMLGKRQEPQFQRAVHDQLGEFVLKQFSSEELENVQDESEMEFSETDELISKAGLFEIIQNKDRMLSLIIKSQESHSYRALSTSTMYGLIFKTLQLDDYVAQQLDNLKEDLQLEESKITEILNHLCINIIAIGVKEKVILTAIPIETPKNGRNQSEGNIQ